MMEESFARGLLMLAIRDNRCAEMLECLFDGGSVTIDMNTGKLMLIPKSVIDASRAI